MKSGLFLILFLSVVSPAIAENMVYLECPTSIPAGMTDSFEVSVFVTNDIALNNLLVCFNSSSDQVKFLSAKPGAALLELTLPGNLIWRTFEQNSEIALVWRNAHWAFMFPAHSTPAEFAKFWMRASDTYSGECVDIDSGYIRNGCYWQWSIDEGPTWFHAGFTDCDTCEISGLIISCGDADASGQIDVTDAVYLVNYIFADGPEPMDPAAGDFDCNDQTDITDAVVMINYIFADGLAPCAACP